MIKKQSLLSRQDTYLITPSLLNSWLYIFNCVDNVREAENDNISLEDKISLAIDKAKADFEKTLTRVKEPPNEYMLAGIEFEDECYKGNTCVSPIIENGAFQIVGTKEVKVDNIKFLMYGRLDVLKGGTIYDIKRVVRYTRGKYKKSSQHRFYMDLFEGTDFEYLIYDGKNLHKEHYFKDECVPTEVVIHNFLNYLKENKNLLKIYVENWRSK